jgi:LSD1 subclass zinc finger protein
MKKSIKNQISLLNEIKDNLNINIVSCGNCGTILAHRIGETKVKCFGCDIDMNLSDCPDLLINN